MALALLGLGTADTPRVSLLAPHRHLELVLAVDGASASTAAPLRPIARLLQTEFGLPLPARITARVYDGPAPFEQGLVAYADVPATRAAEVARFAIGATIPGTVLLRAPAATIGPAVEWPRLIAHELTHLAQIELAGRDTGPTQWLAEGMAEWVAYQVVERLGLGDFASRRASARAAATEYVRRANGLDLNALASPNSFVAQHQRVGTLLTYRLVLHLAGDLISEHGLAPLVGYFRAFRSSDDAAGNFMASFGSSVDGFALAALSRLAPDGPAGAGPALASACSDRPDPPASGAGQRGCVTSPAEHLEARREAHRTAPARTKGRGHRGRRGHSRCSGRCALGGLPAAGPPFEPDAVGGAARPRPARMAMRPPSRERARP
jgi:hypothetical protein